MFLAKVITTEYPNIPIPEATAEQQKPIIDLVDKILALKQANSTADTSEIERKIDEAVYALYSLSAEEIAVIENAKSI